MPKPLATSLFVNFVVGSQGCTPSCDTFVKLRVSIGAQNARARRLLRRYTQVKNMPLGGDRAQFHALSILILLVPIGQNQQE